MAECVQTVADSAFRSGMRSANSTLYVTTRLRTKFEEQVFLYTDPAAWNSLPVEIPDDANLPAFRNKPKTYFFKSYRLPFSCRLIL